MRRDEKPAVTPVQGNATPFSLFSRTEMSNLRRGLSLDRLSFLLAPPRVQRTGQFGHRRAFSEGNCSSKRPREIKPEEKLSSRLFAPRETQTRDRNRVRGTPCIGSKEHATTNGFLSSLSPLYNSRRGRTRTPILDGSTRSLVPTPVTRGSPTSQRRSAQVDDRLGPTDVWSR